MGPLQLNVNLPFVSDLSFNLFDSQGKPVLSKYFTEAKSFSEEIPKFISGIYYAEIIYLGGTERYKIIFY
jgi:hypothetical protein